MAVSWKLPCPTCLLSIAGAVNSLGVVLGQEMERFNRLLQHVTASLQELTKALKVHSCRLLTGLSTLLDLMP